MPSAAGERQILPKQIKSIFFIFHSLEGEGDRFEPISHDAFILVLGVADKDEELAAISQFRPYADAFVVGEITATEIESRTERCQKRFAKRFA